LALSLLRKRSCQKQRLPAARQLTRRSKAWASPVSEKKLLPMATDAKGFIY